MLHWSFLLAAAQLLVNVTSALQTSECCSATSAAQLSENCSTTSVFACVGRKLRGSFYRGQFSQRGASSYWCPWERGLGSSSGGVVGGGFPVENEGKGEGGGECGGWGRDRQRNRQVNARALSKLPFSDLPFIFSPIVACCRGGPGGV